MATHILSHKHLALSNIEFKYRYDRYTVGHLTSGHAYLPAIAVLPACHTAHIFIKIGADGDLLNGNS